MHWGMPQISAALAPVAFPFHVGRRQSGPSPRAKGQSPLSADSGIHNFSGDAGLKGFEAIERDTSLLDALIGMPEIMKHATDAEFASMYDPANHVGLAGEMADRIFDRRRAR